MFLEQHKDAVKLVEKRKLAYTKSKERAKEVITNFSPLNFSILEYRILRTITRSLNLIFSPKLIVRLVHT